MKNKSNNSGKNLAV